MESIAGCIAGEFSISKSIEPGIESSNPKSPFFIQMKSERHVAGKHPFVRMKISDLSLMKSLQSRAKNTHPNSTFLGFKNRLSELSFFWRKKSLELAILEAADSDDRCNPQNVTVIFENAK